MSTRAHLKRRSPQIILIPPTHAKASTLVAGYTRMPGDLFYAPFRELYFVRSPGGVAQGERRFAEGAGAIPAASTLGNYSFPFFKATPRQVAPGIAPRGQRDLG